MAYSDPDKEKEYQKEYRKKNKDKLQEYQKTYYDKNKSKLKEYGKKYGKQNREKYKEHYKEYRDKNKDELQQYQREYRIKNREKKNAYFKKYRDTHRDKMKEYQKAYHNANRETLNDRNNQYITNINNISRKTAFNHHSQWTPEDDDIIIQMFNNKETPEQIASMLNRSKSAINHRIVRLRAAKKLPPEDKTILHSTGQKSIWIDREEDVETIKRLIKEGYRTKDMLPHLSHEYTYAQVSAKVNHLKNLKKSKI